MKKLGIFLLFLLLAFAGCKNKGQTTESEDTMMENTEAVESESMEEMGETEGAEMGEMEEMSDTAAAEEAE